MSSWHHTITAAVRHEPVVLCIAGFDPTGGAGLLADGRALAAIGVRAAGVITALTRQRPSGPAASEPLDARRIGEQIDELRHDLRPRAIKIGMLGSVDIAREVARRLSVGLESTPVVLDPVLTAGGGGRLTEPGVLAVLRERLLPLTTVFTPNLPEAQELLGAEFADPAAMEDAARRLRQWGAAHVLLKGGHLTGDPVDVLAGPDGVRHWRASRVAGSAIHGTGCTLSALIAGYLALGQTVIAAVEQARARLQRAIARAWSPAAEGWRFLGGLDANG